MFFYIVKVGSQEELATRAGNTNLEALHLPI
jgi:hypothetical protein